MHTNYWNRKSTEHETRFSIVELQKLRKIYYKRSKNVRRYAHENSLGYDLIYLDLNFSVISILDQVRHHRQISLYLVCHSHVPRQARSGKWSAWARVRNLRSNCCALQNHFPTRYEKVRTFAWFRHFTNFFPVRVVKTADLSPTKNYLFAVYPHGIIRWASEEIIIFDEFSLLGRSVNQVNLRLAR